MVCLAPSKRFFKMEPAVAHTVSSAMQSLQVASHAPTCKLSLLHPTLCTSSPSLSALGSAVMRACLLSFMHASKT